jgi:thiaminase
VHALVAYYGCERVYLEAWTSVRDRAGADGRYADWVANWSSAGFRAYVDWLGERLDAAVAGLDLQVTREAADVFGEAVRFEIDFWDSCFS